MDPNLQFAMGNLYGPTFVDVALLNVHYNCASLYLTNLPHLFFPSKVNVEVLSIVPMEDILIQGSVIDASKFIRLFISLCIFARCPSGFGGRLCDEVDVSFSQNCGGIVQVCCPCINDES